MSPTDEAIQYLTTCCKRIGAFSGNHPFAFLKNVASQIDKSKPSKVFPARYKEHVAHAVDMVASNLFTSPPAAIASVYLATRFEYYFRILSGKLNADGTWISSMVKSDARAAMNNKVLPDRVSNVSLAYQIMMTDTSLQIVQQCAKIDKCLYKEPITLARNEIVHNIGDRIAFARHRVGHGHWGDISSEAIFYGLMTGIVFYNQA